MRTTSRWTRALKCDHQSAKLVGFAGADTDVPSRSVTATIATPARFPRACLERPDTSGPDALRSESCVVEHDVVRAARLNLSTLQFGDGRRPKGRQSRRDVRDARPVQPHLADAGRAVD